jgi:hypothetical protein
VLRANSRLVRHLGQVPEADPQRQTTHGREARLPEVYVIHLDEWWEIHPPVPKTDEMTITLKAIYEVSPTPESAQYKVWTGRLESHDYKFSLRQW